MVERLKNKSVIFPLVFGLLFSLLYFNLGVKFFALGVVAFIGVMAVLYDVRIGIYAGVFIYPFLPDKLGLLYLIFIVCAYLYEQTFKTRKKLTEDPMDVPIAFYLMIIVFSTITSINFMGSFRDLAIHISALGFVFVMVNSIDNLNDFNKLASLLVFSATLIGLYGLYQYVVGVEIEAAWLDVENNPDIKTRVYSVFGNPNILAEYLVFTIPISVGLMWHSKKLSKKIIFLGTTGIMTLALVLTLSRGGWIGFMVAAFIFVILVEKRLLLLSIPMGIGALYLLPDTVMNRILSIGNLSDSSNAYRIKLWDVTMQVIRDNWQAGVGFGHLPFKQTFETYIRTMPTYHSHNTYLQTAAELGIPGLIAFLFFLFVIFKYGYHRLIKSENNYVKIMGASALAGIGGVFAHGLVENVLYLPRIIITFWILVSFVLILGRIQGKEKKTS